MTTGLTRVKVCGITNAGDASLAVEAGADALGFVFWQKSPRYIDPDAAAAITCTLPPFVTTVGVFVDETEETIRETLERAGLDLAQLHGNEPPELVAVLGPRVIKAIRVRDEADVESIKDYQASAFLLDTFKQGVPGGTGETFDWALARKASALGRIILSGGLNPENVAKAIEMVRPYGVDVSSGVEQSPGRKDPEKVREFVRLARGAA